MQRTIHTTSQSTQAARHEKDQPFLRRRQNQNLHHRGPCHNNEVKTQKTQKTEIVFSCLWLCVFCVFVTMTKSRHKRHISSSPVYGFVSFLCHNDEVKIRQGRARQRQNDKRHKSHRQDKTCRQRHTYRQI